MDIVANQGSNKFGSCDPEEDPRSNVINNDNCKKFGYFIRLTKAKKSFCVPLY